MYLQTIRLGNIGTTEAASFPFNVPIIQSLGTIEFAAPVTFLVGENGSGKSTLLEAIAVAARLPTVGSEQAETDRTLASVRKLASKLKLSWTKRTMHGFFMRSEDFFGYAKRMSEIREGLEQDLREVDQEYADKSEYARGLARMPMLRELGDMKQRYGHDLDARSHGESYFKLFESRFVPNGLYLMDEPEAPLSPMRQLTLLSMLKLMVHEHNAQFIIATHSPLLMAFPDAIIYSFDNDTIQQIAYDDVEHVRITRAFLNKPDQFLHYL